MLILVVILLGGCKNTPSPDPEWAAYLEEIEDWQKQRVERLKSRDGWLNLAGLFWLKEGINTLGSHEDNTLVFPEQAPDYIGKIILTR